MGIQLSQAISWSDWIKIIILLIIAITAWYFVFNEYSKPFDLVSEIERQKLIDDYYAHQADADGQIR